MNRSWAEIRSAAAAAAFARGHAGDRDEQRDTHTFWNDFFANIFGVVDNTFPLLPVAGGGLKPALRRFDPLERAVLSPRPVHPGATLAVLYDPDLMPPDLRKAHEALDGAVDRLYPPSGFASDRKRVEHVFGLYEAMVALLLVAGKKRRRR